MQGMGQACLAVAFLGASHTFIERTNKHHTEVDCGAGIGDATHAVLCE